MTRPASLRKMLPGRRLGDPVELAVDPNIRAVRGRLAAVSVRASLGAGAWVGFALGLVIGMLLGAALVWFAGAVLDWQRDLAFTFGVARRLLPFGDQLGLLRDIQARWWIVVPLAGFTVAGVGLLVGALLGGILGAAYNRSPRHALVVVELPRQVAPPVAPPPQPVVAAAAVAAAAEPARPPRSRTRKVAAQEPTPDGAEAAKRTRRATRPSPEKSTEAADTRVLDSAPHGADREE